ncbi:MAG: hypothetical protein HY288_13205 [Planctomycetia bacterium]|nr:hypothetical protein [Planctomycetia bacterium]
MTKTDDFKRTFETLRDILKKHEKKLSVVADKRGEYSLATGGRGGKPMCVAGVRIGKSYVSYHLMTVYAWPELLDEVSEELKRRMQGKSCFNFRSISPGLMKELAKLTKAGFGRVKQGGLE